LTRAAGFATVSRRLDLTLPRKSMNSRKASLIALAVAVASPSLAAAGTYVESLATNHVTPQAKPQPMKMWAGNGKFRMEMQGGVVQIFRDQAFYTLNTAGKSYTKLDKAALDAMTKQADEAKKNLEAMLPPEQREKRKAQPKPQVDRSVKPTDRTEAAAIGQTCKVWEVFSNGTKVQELCVVEVAKLPNGKELVATMQTVGEAFKGTAASAGMAEVWQDVKTMNGFPVITRVYMNGKLLQEVKTTAIRAADTPESMFTVPAGFKEQKMGEIG
jgi:hypothetical protein